MIVFVHVFLPLVRTPLVFGAVQWKVLFVLRSFGFGWKLFVASGAREDRGFVVAHLDQAGVWSSVRCKVEIFGFVAALNNSDAAGGTVLSHVKAGIATL